MKLTINNAIKNCKECGKQILSANSGDLCEECKAKKTYEQYVDLKKAEDHINNDTKWLKKYSAWTTIMTIPIVILVLVILFYILSIIKK